MAASKRARITHDWFDAWAPIPRKPAWYIGGFLIVAVLMAVVYLAPERTVAWVHTILSASGLLAGSGEAPSPGLGATLAVILAFMWGTALVVVLMVLIGERQALSTIGARRLSGHDFGWVVLLFLAAALVGPILLLPVGAYIYRQYRKERGGEVEPPGKHRVSNRAFIGGAFLVGLGIQMISGSFVVDDPLQELFSRMPGGPKLALIATAAVTEEVIFRGYLIERLYSLTGRAWGSAAIAFLIFTAAHIPGHGLALVLAGTWQVGAALCLLYMRTRSLGACILLHLLINSTLFLV